MNHKYIKNTYKYLKKGCNQRQEKNTIQFDRIGTVCIFTESIKESHIQTLRIVLIGAHNQLMETQEGHDGEITNVIHIRNDRKLIQDNDNEMNQRIDSQIEKRLVINLTDLLRVYNVVQGEDKVHSRQYIREIGTDQEEEDLNDQCDVHEDEGTQTLPRSSLTLVDVVISNLVVTIDLLTDLVQENTEEHVQQIR